MEPIDIIIIVAILLVIGGALAYIIRAKRSGRHCIGCPDSKSCSAKSKSSGCNGKCNACSCGCNSGLKRSEESNEDKIGQQNPNKN